MPTPALLLLIATLLPLFAAVLLLFSGKRIGNPLSGWLATVLISGSFVCTLTAMVVWLQAEPGHYQGSEWGEGAGPINIPVRWIPIGFTGHADGINQDHPGYLDLGLYVDSLTVVMFAMITLVGTLVHFFSIGYMRGEPHHERFFACLSLLCFSTMGLVLGGTLLHILIFWQLAGVCTYLLVSFRQELRTADVAGLKAGVVSAIGGAGFLLGFGILFLKMGNASLPDLWTYLGSGGEGHPLLLPGGVEVRVSILTIAGLSLFVAAAAKAAQFPLHVWFPESTVAPAPGSALLQSTSVVAGVYLVGRIFPILTPRAKLLIAIVGLITLTIGALIAMVQTNLRKLLAYATISQAGYMILALGIGSWVGGLFHLITHAFTTALLFLATGSVLYATGREDELARLGGLWRKLPMTALAFGVAVLVMAGAPYLSEWSSRTVILTDCAAFAASAHAKWHGPAYSFFFILPAAVCYLTAFYMARCWILTFWGTPRDSAIHEGAREYSMMWGPLGALAFMTIVSGRYFNVQPLLESSIRETQSVCHDCQIRDDFFEFREDFAGFDRVWPTDFSAEGENPLVDSVLAAGQIERHWMHWGFLIGLALAALVCIRGYALTGLLLRFPPIRWIYRWLLTGMLIDQLYLVFIAAAVRALANVFDWTDRRVIGGSLARVRRVIRRVFARRAGATR